MRAIDVDLLAQAMRRARAEPTDVQTVQKVAAEYDRLYLRRQQELRAEERDRL